MIPKKAKDFISGHAKDMDIPTADMENIINGFFRAVRQTMTNMEHWNVRVRGLGDFKSSYKKVNEDYYMYLTIKNKYRHQRDSPEYKEAKEKLFPLIQMKRSFYKEWIREKQAKKRKLMYKINKYKNQNNDLERDNTTSMEEPGTDS